MEQSIRELLETDETELGHRIAEVEKLLQRKYGKLTLSGEKSEVAVLQKAIDDGVLSPRQAGTLQNAGLAFGSIAVQAHGLRWVMVEDDYGTDPALQDPDTEQVFQALTLISNHFDDGKCDLKALLAALGRRDSQLLAQAS
ncbi:MAG: DUF3806 domain-containing protein [Myxococcota bacterium]|nr:DUF3806 domain-containing protein [Myxococcota bacterium]